VVRDGEASPLACPSLRHGDVLGASRSRTGSTVGSVTSPKHCRVGDESWRKELRKTAESVSPTYNTGEVTLRPKIR
jgi:hypothetical protein